MRGGEGKGWDGIGWVRWIGTSSDGNAFEAKN